MAKKSYGAAFDTAWKLLNPAQKAAVKSLDGPVMVIAGPGTGKTQLLATRIGHILKTTDTSAENILCLTFSESAVKAMKQRLAELIGPEAYNVEVSTYHAFGSNLLKRYPDLFMTALDFEPSDELVQDRLLREVQSELPYSNPLKDEFYLSDLKSLISGFKKAMLNADDLEHIADINDAFADDAANLVNQLIDPDSRISKQQVPLYQKLLDKSPALAEGKTINGIMPLKLLWMEELSRAIETAIGQNKTTGLSSFKAAWLQKDSTGTKYTLKSQKTDRMLRHLAEAYRQYEGKLSEAKLYDYDDMIMLAIKGLDNHPEIKLDLQEKYLYIQLDEFQDTNASQLRLIEHLSDNPISEGRPNILAVGDDDQAIYSFQGAHYSNMEQFYNCYKDVKLINLVTNYRSTPGIISFSSALRNLIQEGLSLSEKVQTSSRPKDKGTIMRVELELDIEQLAWVADYVSGLISSGSKPDSIAIIAPKHEQLEELIPYLHAKQIPLSYERKDDVLADPLVNQLLTCLRLVIVAGEGGKLEDSLWPRVISQNYWQLPTTLIWKLSWKAREEKKPWIKLLLNNPLTKPIALFFIRLHQIAESEPFELIINYLSGTINLSLNEKGLKDFTSPFYGYYLEDKQKDNLSPESWRFLGALSLLIARTRSSGQSDLTIYGFMSLIDDYLNAHIHIEDKSPFIESLSAVNLMSAHASKGQEFDTVVLINAQDGAWGRSSKGRGYSLSLPANLKQIRYGNRGDDELLRLLFVAASRAKNRLIMSGYREKINGQEAERLTYLTEHEEQGRLISPLLPKSSQEILQPSASKLKLSKRRPEWFDRHLDTFQPEKKALLSARLADFSLSATNLNKYTNVESNGPRQLYLEDILRFPVPPAPRMEYGSVIHDTLDWQFKFTRSHGSAPTVKQLQQEFISKLSKRELTKQEFTRFAEQGKNALAIYVSQTKGEYLGADDLSESGFLATIGDARLVGKIDRLVIDKKARTIRIVDFKTGLGYEKWSRAVKPIHHKRQLYFYKLLVESSPLFKGYGVKDATIQFVEPDPSDGSIKSISLTFEEKESEHLISLIKAVWQNIMKLNFPDTTNYPKGVKGIEKFESELLKEASKSL